MSFLVLKFITNIINCAEKIGIIRKVRQLPDGLYRVHRRKAKVAFRNGPVTLQLLAVDKSQPGSYVKWMETVKKFYAEISGNEELKNKLLAFKVTEEEMA
jgi:hypothetical protein